MRLFLNKSTQRIKKKAGQAVDLLQPPSRQSRFVSPASSQQIEQMTGPNFGAESQPSADNATASMIQLATASTSGVVAPSQVGEPAVTEPAPPPAIPEYAEAPSPPTVLATTGAAVKGLLAAARDGSDLFLPLKAALVGVVALWDIFDASHPTLL